MNDNLIKTVGQWAKYLGAVCGWFAESLTSFPKRKDFFSANGYPKKTESERVQW